MKNEALMFIPDISGFTTFMTRCRIEHSKQIIFNLIDIILKTNQIGLKLSEIEGDAVLFYQKDIVAGKDVIIQQARNMFVAFHNSLETMKNSHFCNCTCGGCSKASNLTLKFIVHYGACKEVYYNGFTKLIGSDVILAHRLLKSTVPEREYILFSEQYLRFCRLEERSEEWVTCYPHMENIENFGSVKSEYIPLYPLRKTMESPANGSQPESLEVCC